MTITEAKTIAISVYNEEDIDYFVQINGGWVVMGKLIMQPLYISDNETRGLSLSVKEDMRIIDAAEEKIKSGDYY